MDLGSAPVEAFEELLDAVAAVGADDSRIARAVLHFAPWSSPNRRRAFGVPSSPMRPGKLVDERFEIVREAGAGGMGTVYEAIDRRSGATVALKILRDRDPHLQNRFEREAQVLAELHLPGVVRYVAHGAAERGDIYLAMEWLKGEDLATRLARTGLTIAESVELARRVAETLSATHRHGVIHRDIKPANLFLPGGEIERVTILDFGVARHGGALTRATRTGSTLGTPAYMAPEQARGARDVDARADVFSLGCVLFECLTGAPPFTGEHVMAVLAKVLLEDAPLVRKLRAEIGEPLELLVAWMLEKDVANRPRDAEAVAAALAAVELADAGDAPFLRPHGVALTASEQRLLSIVLAGRAPELTESDPTAPTVVSAADSVTLEPLHRTIRDLGGRLEQLAEGTLVVTVAHLGAATDQATRAARCALALRRVLAGVPIAIATGRGEVAGRVPVGEVIDRAAEVLAAAGDDERTAAVRLDEVTVGLLDAHFDIGGDAHGLLLFGERDVTETTRTLMGRETVCVGREQEIGALESLLGESIDESSPRVALVTAAAGMGKSRVRYELVRRMRARVSGLEVWIARGDPMSAGSPFAMIAPVVRRVAGILDGEPLVVRRQKLRARLRRNVPPAELTRVTEFLGELAAVPFDDESSVQLSAARRDPTLMGDQMRRAWEDFLDFESAVSPILLVLEDLHWGDAPSLRYVDAALRQLENRSLMVLGCGRPEVSELFPRLWAERSVLSIALRPLSKKASEKLVAQVIGEDTPADLVARVVERAGGNALYLEEMIRAVGEGKGDALPDTVLAMVEARLERLPTEARRVLRAASVFGQAYCEGGVLALLGVDQRTTPSAGWHDELVERELVSARATARFPGEREYVFRNALVRDAAYAMLTEHDRALGHRLAGGWLEERGESDSAVLAEHFERGGDAPRAAVCYARAAAQAIEGNDFAAVIARVARAVRCGAAGTELGALRLLEAKAERWRGAFPAAKQAAEEALALLKRSSPEWYEAAGELGTVCGALAEHARLFEIATLLREDDGPIDGRRVVAAALAVVQLNHTGRYALAQSLLDWIMTVSGPVAAREPLVAGFALRAAMMRAASDVLPGPLLEACAQSERCFLEAGDLRMACFQRMNLGYANIVVGLFEEAESVLAAAEATASRLNLPHVAASTRSYLGYAIGLAGRTPAAIAVLRESIARIHAQGDRRMEGRAENYLAQTLARAGDLAEAELAATRAIDACAALPTTRALARITWASVVLARGRVDEALAATNDAMALLAAQGSVEDGETLLRVTHAEALSSSNRGEDAKREIAIAQDRLLARAATIADPATRATFLERVPENARTIALARAYV